MARLLRWTSGCLAVAILFHTVDARFFFDQLRNAVTSTPEPASGRIIGGTPVAYCRAPYNSVAAFQRVVNEVDIVTNATTERRLTFCTGTLLSPDTILTSAFCMVNFVSGGESEVRVILGDLELRFTDSGEQVMAIDSITIHPEYNPTTFYANLAIVKLTANATVTDCVRPLERFTQDADQCPSVAVTESCSVAGFGAFDENFATQNTLSLLYGGVRLLDETLTSLVYRYGYEAPNLGSLPVPPRPADALIAEPYPDTSIRTCLYDWGSLLACQYGTQYQLRGVVLNMNCEVATAGPIPILTTDIVFHEAWIDSCLANYPQGCATVGK